MRLFTSIELPEPVVEHLATVARRMQQDPDLDDSMRWVQRQNAHLTLKFIGEIHNSPVAELVAALSNVPVERMRLRVNGVLYFPRRGPVHVIAVSVEDQLGSLSLLHERLEQACEVVGLTREARAFLPHITLARWRPGPQIARLTWIRQQTYDELFPGPDFEVQNFALMQSQLGPAGPKYIVQQWFPADPNIS